MKGLLTLCAVVLGFAVLGLGASFYVRQPAGDECLDNGVCAKGPPTTAERTYATDAPRKQAGLFFPAQPSPDTDYMMAEVKGRLVVGAGCVRIRAEEERGGPGSVVVWPAGYSLAKNGGGVLVLGRKGKAEARIGDEVSMGGGQISEGSLGEDPEARRRAFEEVRRRYGVPGRCRGPLWVAAPGVRAA